MKDIFRFLVALIICLSFVSMSPNEFAVRFTGVECSVSDKNSTNYHFCNVKAFSRKVTALNFGFRLIRELNTFNMNHQIFYKYGTIYRQVMKANAEWCSLMGKNSKNILLDMFINVVKETAPGITHECPYMGLVEVKNLTLDLNKVLSVYPQGDYMSHWTLSDDKDDKIYNIRVSCSVRSSIKTSF